MIARKLIPIALSLAGALLAIPRQLPADTAADNAARLKQSAVVLREIMDVPERSIPQDLLDKARCMVIVPGVKKGAFIVGGEYGKGYMVCRNRNGVGWGAPAAIRIEGGSVGFQIGGSETDVVMLVMNQGGVNKLLQSKFTLGGTGEVAGGPVGRTATAQTDLQMHAEILSYSRSRGLFAGVSLKGATLRQDSSDNKALYGRPITNSQIVLDHPRVPPAARTLISELNRYSPRERR